MTFLHQAQAFLYHIAQQVETISCLDYDEAEHSLTIHLPDQRVYLFNIHQGMEQVWLSSPFSGGRHFFYQAPSWMDTRSGEDLLTVLKTELETQYHIAFE